jgi:hypothetical protein
MIFRLVNSITVMRKYFRFNTGYFVITLLLLGIEVCIALFVHDNFIRPYIGDLLVVIFMYAFFRSFLDIPVTAAVVGVLLFSYAIEIMQYFQLVRLLGLQQSNLARILLGTSFAWADMIAYTAGALIILLVEKNRRRSKN